MKPLTIEQFDTSDSFVREPYMNSYELMIVKFVRLDKSLLPPLRIDGDLKVFINKGTYSLAITVDETNEKFFKSLEFSLSVMASGAIGGKAEDYKLIKGSNVYCKIYTYHDGKPKCLCSELRDGRRRYEGWKTWHLKSLRVHAL